MIFQSNILIIWRVVLLLAIGIDCCVNAEPLEDPGGLPHKLKLIAQCNADRSLTLEFPPEQVGKLTMYSLHDFFSPLPCGERRVSERRQLLEPKCNFIVTNYDVYIFRNEDESGNTIAVHPDDLLGYYSYYFNCDQELPKVPTTVELIKADVLNIRMYFQQTFIIGDKTYGFSKFTISNKYESYGNLGDPVKIVIDIKNKNLFGKKSHFESCKLDIQYADRDAGDSISILENSSLKPEYRSIDFKSEYTPSRGSHEPAKFTVTFKAFMLRSGKRFIFNCQACTNCEPPIEYSESNGATEEHAVSHQLNINWHCSDDSSLILEFPSEEVEKLTTYSTIDTTPLQSICEAGNVNGRTQLLGPECRFYMSSPFRVNILKNENELGNKIAVHPDDMPRYFYHWFNCAEKDSNKGHTAKLQDASSNINPYLPSLFEISGKVFEPVITFLNENENKIHLGEVMNVEIEIGDKNLFGEKSRLESCKLDIQHVNGQIIESIYILKNSSLTPEGSKIEFRSAYTPSRGFNSAKYTLQFKAFALRSRKPSNFNCQACTNCEPVESFGPTSADDGHFNPSLNAIMQCNANGALSLEFPSEVVGKLIMYSEVVSYGNSDKICGERLVGESRQLLEPKCRNSDPAIQDEYLIKIFEHGYEPGNKIVLRPDDMPRHYYGFIKCHDRESQERHTVHFNDSSVGGVDYFELKFLIGNMMFDPIITFFNEEINYGQLGEPVKMEIEIRDKNLFGQKSHFKHCKLDIRQVDGHFESIPILENFSLTPEGSAIGFRAKYTPSGRYYNNRGHKRGYKRGYRREYGQRYRRGYRRGYKREYRRGYKPAKYTVEFKTFLLRNSKQFNFNCHATSY